MRETGAQSRSEKESCLVITKLHVQFWRADFWITARLYVGTILPTQEFVKGVICNTTFVLIMYDIVLISIHVYHILDDAHMGEY